MVKRKEKSLREQNAEDLKKAFRKHLDAQEKKKNAQNKGKNDRGKGKCAKND